MNDGFQGGRVLTLVRGPEASKSPAPVRTLAAQTMAPPAEAPSGALVYGVPVTAIQHCCGRGCKHCRIHWRRFE